MKPNLPLLTLRAAALSAPPKVQTVQAWLNALADDQASDTVSDYRGLTQILFAQLGIDPAELNAPRRVLALLSGKHAFRDAGSTPQLDLARTAVQALARQLAAHGDEERLSRCGLALYAHTSLDENFYQSTICRLMAEFGLSKAQHCSVGQLQGAAWFQALDIAQAFFQTDTKLENALFVAAEKWPLPYPRVLSTPAILGDGAAAVLLERSQADRPGLRLIGTAMRCFDDFGDPHSVDRTLDRRAMAVAVQEAVHQLLEEQGCAIDRITAFVPCGLSDAVDDLVATRLDINPLTSIPRSAQDTGYLCAAAAPAGIVDVLHQMAMRKLAPGSTVLTWGVGVGGSAGAALLRVDGATSTPPGAQA